MEVQHSETDVQGDTKKRWGLLGTPTSIYLIRFIYYIYNYRLLYYLPMKMTKVDENIQTAQNLLSWIVERCYELEEENKKLKKDLAETQKIGESWRQECKQLRERINTMQEFIDYSEWVVQNAIWMLYEEWWEDKALDYLENCYATGDDKQYEEMERLYKDED